MSELCEIRISGFRHEQATEEVSVRLQPGRVLMVWSAETSNWTALLDKLAEMPGGREKGDILVTAADGRGSNPLRVSAVLPAPGREVYVGTTVGEQLGFYGQLSTDDGTDADWLDEKFGFDFAAKQNHSVWDLGAGERRCLLMVSQALTNPQSWILYEPLDRMDGIRGVAIKEFLQKQKAQGRIIIIGSSNPAELMSAWDDLLVPGESVESLEFYGKGDSAKEFLVSQRAITGSIT